MCLDRFTDNNTMPPSSFLKLQNLSATTSPFTSIFITTITIPTVGINDYKLKNSMDSKDKDSISNEVSSKYENDISLRVETVVEK